MIATCETEKPVDVDEKNGQRSIVKLQEHLDRDGIPYTVEPTDNPEFDGGKRLVVENPFEKGKQGFCFVRRGFYCYWDESGVDRGFKDFCKARNIPNLNRTRKPKTTADKFHQFLNNTFDVGKTPEETLHASYRSSDGVETSLVTTDFRDKALGLFRQDNPALVSNADRNKAFENWKSDKIVSAPVQPLHIRTAECTEPGFQPYIVLDTGDAQRNVIVVSQKGNLKHPALRDIRFLRDKKSPPLALPENGGTIALLKRYLNVGDAFPLVAACIAYDMRPGPTIIYPVLALDGPAGLGKSSTATVITEFLDPKPERKLSQQSKSVHDQLVACRYQWLVIFNNLAKLTKELSDLICCLVEGVINTNRKLFTDGDLFSIAAHRPVLITSVNNVITA